MADKEYLLTFRLTDGNSKSVRFAVPQGEKGEAGVGISEVNAQYYLSTSAQGLVDGTWLSSMPTITEGTYLWNRHEIVYSNGESRYTAECCISLVAEESVRAVVDSGLLAQIASALGGKIFMAKE